MMNLLDKAEQFVMLARYIDRLLKQIESKSVDSANQLRKRICSDFDLNSLRNSVTEAEGCLRGLHAADLGQYLALLPREVVGRLTHEDKEFRRVSVALRMDRDAALPALRISRPGYVESWAQKEFILKGEWSYGEPDECYNDDAYYDDDDMYYQYILKLPSLRRLTLFNAPMPVFCLRAAAVRCACLRHLSLTFNVIRKHDKMRATAYDVEGMAVALSHLTTLKSLHLAGLGQDCGEVLLAAVTRHLTGLRALRLLVWNEVMQQVTLLSKLMALQQLEMLEMLNGVYNDKDDDGYFMPLLMSDSPTGIHLHGYTMDTIKGVMDVFMAAQSATAMSRLTSLELTGNTLNTSIITKHIYKVSNSLTELVVSNNDITYMDNVNLQTHICNMPHLQRLDLSGSRTISWAMFVLLLRVLTDKESIPLRTLDLAGTISNQVMDPNPYIEELQRALQKMHSLQELNLSDNMFRDTVAIAVGTAIAKLPRLCLLRMTHNKLDVPGVTALIQDCAQVACLHVLTQEMTFDSLTVKEWHERRPAGMY